jgi:hypothetical protein
MPEQGLLFALLVKLLRMVLSKLDLDPKLLDIQPPSPMRLDLLIGL